MKKLNPEHARIYSELFCNSPWSAATGCKFTDLEIGYCRGEAYVDERHHNAVGTVHGGAIAAIFDMVLYSAAYAGMPEEFGMTTVDLTTNYLRPAVSGKIICEAKVTKLGRTLSWVEGTLTDEDGKLLATCSEKVFAGPNLMPFNVRAAQLQPGLVMPPKFIEVEDE